MNLRTKGYLLGIAAASTYGMNPLFALPLYQRGMNSDSVLLFRYMLAIFVIGGVMVLEKRSFLLPKKDLLLTVVMGILMAASSLFLFQSYFYMDAGIASTMLFVYPIMVALGMLLFFKERLTWQTCLCTFMAVGGIFLLYKQTGGATLSVTGTVLVFLSALSYAVYIISVNQTHLREVSALVLTFYVLVFGTFLFVGRIATGAVSLTMPNTPLMWACALAIALFPTAISFFCSARAIQYIGPTPTAILGALEPLTAIFFGVLVFGERLTLRDWTGVFLILAAVTLVVCRRRQR